MKSYTDIEQSKKLAKILSAKSADAFYDTAEPEKRQVPIIGDPDDYYDMEDWAIPCWSLTALLDIIPSGQINFIRLPLNGENLYAIQVLCGEEWKFSNWKSDPIDACVEMIYKLKEKNLL